MSVSELYFFESSTDVYAIDSTVLYPASISALISLACIPFPFQAISRGSGHSVQSASPQVEKLASVRRARRIATDHQDPVTLVLRSFLDVLFVLWEEFVVGLEEKMRYWTLQDSKVGKPESLLSILMFGESSGSSSPKCNRYGQYGRREKAQLN